MSLPLALARLHILPTILSSQTERGGPGLKEIHETADPFAPRTCTREMSWPDPGCPTWWPVGTNWLRSVVVVEAVTVGMLGVVFRAGNAARHVRNQTPTKGNATNANAVTKKRSSRDSKRLLSDVS